MYYFCFNYSLCPLNKDIIIIMIIIIYNMLQEFRISRANLTFSCLFHGSQFFVIPSNFQILARLDTLIMKTTIKSTQRYLTISVLCADLNQKIKMIFMNNKINEPNSDTSVFYLFDLHEHRTAEKIIPLILLKTFKYRNSCHLLCFALRW